MHIAYSGKVFFAPNTSDEQIIDLAKKRLVESGIKEEHIQVNYNVQELEVDDLYISYEPPHLVIRNVYEKKSSGMIKMRNTGMIEI
ncbi:MAG TPA: hypothetical protein VFG77_04440 [Nitrososphaeraceae archaeon]|jgi:hypothetical protein|nr:hypothetical protein [Nitrososphaeraceae archaeon]